LQTEIYNIDYTQLVHIFGTTHFSKQSLLDASRAVERLKPTDLAIELDMKRYRILAANAPVALGTITATVNASSLAQWNFWAIEMQTCG